MDRPITELESRPLLPPAPPDPRIANALGTTFTNTSAFLAGDVAVGIIRPESTGVIDGNTENWTDSEVTNSLAQVMAALDKLTNDSPRGKLTFVLRTESFGPGVAGTVSCDYEAIQHQNWTTSVVLNFLGKLGYTQANYYNRLREWDDDLRSDLGTDWAYGFIIVDNSGDTSQGRASAYLNGPGAWLFQSSSAKVYHHESGHVWGAQDEYHPDAGEPPTDRWGYMQEPNANSQFTSGSGFFGGAGEGIPALMIDNRDYASPWTRGAWGIWDLDGDGINDTQDTFPTVTLNTSTGTSTFTFTGSATATALKREDTVNFDADITINKIVLVEWRINGGPWQNATASDGAFNTSTENFTVTTAALRNGPYFFEARARDNFGNTTQNLPRVSVTASGSGVTNNVPAPALTVTPLLGSTTTAFAFSAAGSLDYEDSGNLQYRWDFENDGTYDTAFSATPTATQTYGSAGSKTATVEVRDQGGAVSTRSVTFTVSATNTTPTATFTVDKGSLFATATVVFNFDASSVSDGEDASSALQVRWDFDDDGVWDTAFSTTKTIAHDYAQGFAITASNETANTYLYSGNNVTGYAQGFVAGSTSIGKAELILQHNNDNTAEGTCTVGIRSSLTGSYLTSVTRDQTSLTESDWNLFDFPDITVTNGAMYFLVMICSDGDIMWKASGTNPYAGGQHHFSFNAGTSWSTNGSFDHAFRVYDGVLSTIPLTKSKAWRVRMEVMDANAQTTQTVRDIWTNAYDTPPTVSLGSSALSGTTATTFNLTATGFDADSGTTWDGLLHYRWDVDGDGNYETQFATGNTRNATFTKAGVYQATVEVRDRYHATARASVNITVAPTSGATQISISSGDNQTGPSNAALPVAPAVLVRDAGSNPVSGVLVVFSVVSGGGKITNATQVTNGSGIATLGNWTLGASAGANSIQAQMPHFPQSTPLAFTATAVNSTTLTISKAGTGSGTVTSNPAGISCGATCAFDFSNGASVTLTAVPVSGSDFVGWSGSGCTGIGTCQVTTDAAKTVTASFNARKRSGQMTSN